MKKPILLLMVYCVFGISLNAQVTFIIDSLPDYTPAEDILYIAGDFQGWNPGDPNYALEKNASDKWTITLDSTTNGTAIHFKFTRGDWSMVEKGIQGEEIPNREFIYGNGDTVYCIIYNWADAGGTGNSTAAENVSIMDEEFYIPQLDRNRRIWVYLPPDYNETDDHYPVIYMHDGQNLFDTYTSYAGEWEVDESLNELFDQGYFVPIVVGIDNGGVERVNEYTPWVNDEYGGGQGKLYAEFIVETLKPYIDATYRTMADRKSTAIWGSSLGGLISQYGIMEYQDVFSKAGIYSPSYWWSDTVWTFTSDAGIQEDMKLYQMTGEFEGGSMVPDTWLMDDLLKSMGLGEEELSTKIVEDGQHNEELWREDFAEAYLWLFHSFANSVGERKIKNLAVYPNPVRSTIKIPYLNDKPKRVFIQDIQGRIIYSHEISYISELDLTHLSPGIYFLEIMTDDAVYIGKFIKQN